MSLARALPLAAAVALVLGGPAAAATLTDPHGFALDLAAGGVRVCVGAPEALRRDGDCAGVDLAPIEEGVRLQRQTLAEGSELLGYLVFVDDEGSRSVLLVTSDDEEVPAQEDIDRTITGYLNHSGARGRPNPDGRIGARLTVAGTPAVRVICDQQPADGPALVGLTWFVFADGRSYRASLVAAASNEAAARTMMDKLLASVRLRPLPPAKAAQVGRYPHYLAAYVAVGVLALAGLCGLLAWALRPKA